MKCTSDGCEKEACRFAKIRGGLAVVAKCGKHFENFKQFRAKLGGSPSGKSVTLDMLTEQEIEILQVQES